jgi:hypothetical protein
MGNLQKTVSQYPAKTNMIEPEWGFGYPAVNAIGATMRKCHNVSSFFRKRRDNTESLILTCVRSVQYLLSLASSTMYHV